MPNNPNIPIHSIQLLDIPLPDRNIFLDSTNTHVLTFALQRQELFKAVGLDATLFHNNQPQKAPVLVHSLHHNGFLTLRAYTQKAIDTLLFWFQLFKKEHPQLCQNTIQSQETFVYKLLNKPITYQSKLWIPYRNCAYHNKEYTDKDQNQIINKQDFINRLTANLLTFLGTLNLDTVNTRFTLSNCTISPKHKSIVALKTLEKGTLLSVKKYAFSCTFSINLQLPWLISLGQNVSYGNGVFIQKPLKNGKKPHTQTNRKTRQSHKTMQ